MPALSPTMEEGTLAKWHVKVGDEVRSGDVIAEIETDKATMEVEAVDEGKIAAIPVPEGAQNVKVNTPIARLADGDEASARAEPDQAAAKQPVQIDTVSDAPIAKEPSGDEEKKGPSEA